MNLPRPVWLLVGVLALNGDAFGQVRGVIPHSRSDVTSTSPARIIDSGPAVTLGQPEFDPYSTSSGAGGSGTGAFFDSWNSPYSAPSSGYGTNSYGQPVYGGGPSSLFPQGIYRGEGGFDVQPVRFLRGPRFQHAWIAGDDGREMDIHDSDISVVVTYPNFLFSSQPIYIAPGFSLHQWDNPEPPDFPTTAVLPSKAYSAYLDTLFRTDPNNIVGGEIMGRVGIFTDFSTATSDSLRVMGGGNLLLRLTPTTTLKGGAFYTDRAKVKLIPSGGILWQPNDKTRFDIYFPQPKLASYLTTAGSNYDIWWYLKGEYGGGSWTIKREIAPVFTDRFDYNDIRFLVGLEWGPSEMFKDGRRLGFVEAGWVTDREGIYVARPGDSFTLRDSFILRAGVGY